MIKYLIKIFIPDYKNIAEISVRKKYSYLSGILGIICNIILFIIKLVIGIITGSMAITADAFNNLSDTGSSIVTVIGTKLGSASADKEHPFGHGRYEYIASLIVSFIIVIVGFELLKSSFIKIISPQKISLSFLPAIILILTLIVKIWMFSYNRYMGKKINSNLLMAAAYDSRNDVLTTLAVIISAVVDSFIPFSIDGYSGTLISLYIMYSGYRISKDTIGIILGTQPDKALYDNINNIILENDIITGVHDLVIHDYGPGRIMASVHAEVPADCDIIKIHDIIDTAESRIEKELNVHTVIHMDPVISDCEKTSKLKAVILNCLNEINSSMSIHDFKVSESSKKINVFFDLCIPSDIDNEDEIIEKLKIRLKEIDKRYNLIVKIDYII